MMRCCWSLLVCCLFRVIHASKRKTLEEDDPLFVPDCRDEDSHCPTWKKAGYCLFPAVKVACRHSCPHVCQNGSFDFGVKQQALDHVVRMHVVETIEYLHTVVYQDGDDDDHYDETMRRNCRNLDERCSHWAVRGECEENHDWMSKHCAPACETCHYVALRCPWEAKDVALRAGDLNQMFHDIVEKADYNVTVLSQPPHGPWVVVLDDFVTDEECERLIELGTVQGYSRSEGAAPERGESGEYLSEVSDYRTSYQAWCLDECTKDPVAQSVSQRIAQLTGIPETHSEYFQLLKYKQGQYYKVHHDYIPLHQERPMGPRILTVFLYLSNVEDGGGTVFPSLGNLTVKPQKRRALIWPSVLDSDPMAEDPRTSHEALPVLSGEKYGANAWLHLGNFKKAFANDCVN